MLSIPEPSLQYSSPLQIKNDSKQGDLMTENNLDRKLKAIFSADVKGYSRLMGEDEEYTVKTITAYRETISGLISKHKGRVVDSPGDNILAEFALQQFCMSTIQ